MESAQIVKFPVLPWGKSAYPEMLSLPPAVGIATDLAT